VALIKSRDDLKVELAYANVGELVDGKTSRTVTIQVPKGTDRVETLIKAADILKSYGGKYNDKGGQSSIGRTECNGGYYVECKHKGGGGSGAGSDLTAIVESAQCVYLAVKYNKKGVYTTSNMSSASRHYDVTETLEKIQSKLPEKWIASSKKGSDKIAEKFPNITKSYVCHRGSSWVSALEAHWKTLNVAAGKPFGDINKWSPADIWLISSQGSRVDITQATSLVELNQLLVEQYQSKDIVGVSLKQIQTATARFGELNMDSARKEYKYESSTLGLRGFWMSQDGYIYFAGQKIQFRKFGSTWQGELKGQFANMGKVSGGPVANIVKDVFDVDLVPQRLLKNRTQEDEDQFYEWYKKVPYTEDISKSDFLSNLRQKDQNWYLSKIMTVQLFAIVENGTVAQKNAFTSGLVNYAGSESRLSGPYCKVY
jgi:hypothetical protein